MTTDTITPPPVPQAFADAAKQAGLTLTRTHYGLELTDERGHGMTFTPDFEHEIPMLCANGGAMFKKRFARDDDNEQDAAAGEDDDEGDEVQLSSAPYTAEDFQDFRESTVERLSFEAGEMCAAIQYGKFKTPDPLGALTDLMSASQVLSELAAAILEMHEPEKGEEEPASS